jgi:hypothetical protein
VFVKNIAGAARAVRKTQNTDDRSTNIVVVVVVVVALGKECEW